MCLRGRARWLRRPAHFMLRRGDTMLHSILNIIPLLHRPGEEPGNTCWNCTDFNNCPKNAEEEEERLRKAA